MTDTDALTERIARAFYENRVAAIESDQERQSWPAWDDHEKADADEWRDAAAAVLPMVAAEVRKAKAEALTKRWVCQVARSGYHAGASCRPHEAHNDWGCDYYYEASIRATEYETGDPDEHR